MIYAFIFFVRHFLFVLAIKVFRQIVGIPMGTNCAPLIVLL